MSETHPRIFGTDGVRGPATMFDDRLVHSIGMAAGYHFAEPGQSFIIGGDTRESTPRIIRGLGEGLVAAGINVRVIDRPIPTPGIAYLTRESDPDVRGGIAVTASHNPYEDNGVKIFSHSGDKLPDDTEDILDRAIREGVEGRKGGSWGSEVNARGRYMRFLVDAASGDSFGGLRLGVDTAHGAASGFAEAFAALGADVTAIGEKPNGRNINDGHGATDTAALRALVQNNKLDMGVALDGDADRIMMVDEQGREVNGDHLMYLLAVTGEHKGVVATKMSNLALEQALERQGIALLREDVGDRYVLRGLEQTGWCLGGEQSGHIIQPDILATGDGMLAAVSAIRMIRASGMPLSAWRDQVPMLPQKLVNIQVPDKALMQHPDVQAFVSDAEQAFGDTGRLLLRPSGTEPKVRVMVEALTETEATQKAHSIASALQAKLASLG